MVRLSGVLEKFGDMGEKTGWTYLPVPAAVARKINPGVKRSYRVKGKLNNIPAEGLSLMPVGKGKFILVFNAALRKLTGKKAGDRIIVHLEPDYAPRLLDKDFLLCLDDDAAARDHFNTLSPSHQRYFSTWIASAKTEATKTKRIVSALNALSRKMGFPEMLREAKATRQRLKEG